MKQGILREILRQPEIDEKHIAPAATVRKLVSPLTAEIKVKNSRFIAHAFSVSTKSDAENLIASVRDRFSDATHNCFAFRIGADGLTFRSDDDGEPTGTAGAPILRQIDSFDLIDVLVVVTRYYGGTKLGAGGLIRAYGGAAREVLSNARIVETILRKNVRVSFDYSRTSAVSAIINKYDADVAESTYEDKTRMVIAVPENYVAHFISEFVDAVQGKDGTIEELD